MSTLFQVNIRFRRMNRFLHAPGNAVPCKGASTVRETSGKGDVYEFGESANRQMARSITMSRRAMIVRSLR